MWPHVTRSDPEVTSFHRKSPGSCCRRLITLVLCTLRPYWAVTRMRWQGRHRKWRHVTGSDPQVTSFERKSPGIGCRRPKTRVLCIIELLHDCNSEEEAVTWQEMTSRDLTSSKLTQKWGHFTGSHQEVVVEVWSLGFCVHLSFYRVGTRRRWQSCDRKWLTWPTSHHVTLRDRKWPESDVISMEVSRKWL